MPNDDLSELEEAERFINSLLAQPDMHALDQALAVLSADDLRVIVRRLITDIGPVNRWSSVVSGEPPSDDVRHAFETLLDAFAVQTEHRDITRPEAMRELLVGLLNDNGRRFEWTREERYRDWMRAAIESLDRQQADDS